MQFYGTLAGVFGVFVAGGVIAVLFEGAEKPQLFFTGGLLLALLVFAGRNFQLLQHEVVGRLRDESEVQLIARPESMSLVEIDDSYQVRRELFIAVSSPVGSAGTVTMELPDGATATPVTRTGWFKRTDAGPWHTHVRQPGFQDLGTFKIELNHEPRASERIILTYDGKSGDQVLRDNLDVPLYIDLIPS